MKCPKCGGKLLRVVEVIEASSEHIICNDTLMKRYDNNEYGNLIRIECHCLNCHHSWTSKKHNFDDMYIKKSLEYVPEVEEDVPEVEEDDYEPINTLDNDEHYVTDGNGNVWTEKNIW